MEWSGVASSVVRWMEGRQKDGAKADARARLTGSDLLSGPRKKEQAAGRAGSSGRVLWMRGGGGER